MSFKDKEKAIEEFLDAWRKLSLFGVTVCDARNGEPMDSDDVSFDMN